MNRRDFLKSIAAAGAGVIGAKKGLSQNTASAGLEPPGHAGRQHVYTWKGSPHQIGFQHGKTLREEIMKEADPGLTQMARKRKTSPGKALDYFVSKYEPIWREHAPMALEEIRGMGRGSGLGYNYAFFAATRDGSRISGLETGACTAIGCGKPAAEGGKVLLGQNKDTDSHLDRYRIMRLGYNSGRRMILLNYPGWVANIGLTSDGVAFTGNALFGRGYAGETMPGSLVKRLILEKGSVGEILAALPKLPVGNGCIMIADATGRVVCLEFCAGRTNIREVSDTAFGHANSITCEEFKPFEPEKLESPSSPVRQKNVQRRLDALRGRLTVARAQSVFADHTDFPLSICHHGDHVGEVGTTASFVANLTDREIHIAVGNPCTAPYRRYTFDF